MDINNTLTKKNISIINLLRLIVMCKLKEQKTNFPPKKNRKSRREKRLNMKRTKNGSKK